MSHQKRKLQCISSKPKAFFSLCSINIAKSLWVSIYSRTHNKESAGQREQSQSRVQSQLINAELCKYQKQKAHKNGEQSKTAHENMINWAYQAISWNEQRSLVYEIIIFLFCADAQQNESQFNVCSFFYCDLNIAIPINLDRMRRKNTLWSQEFVHFIYLDLKSFIDKLISRHQKCAELQTSKCRRKEFNLNSIKRRFQEWRIILCV